MSPHRFLPVSLVRRACKRIVAIGTAAREEWFYEHNEHVMHFTRCLGFVGENGIQGDILEFGVSTGDTLIILERLAERLLRRKQNMACRLFGFDSFEGLPEPSGLDRDAHMGESRPGIKFQKGMYKCSRESVFARLERAEEVNVHNIQLIEGWYAAVLIPELRARLRIRRASLINIDCDFYESTVPVLNWCEPLMEQGTVITFDDWFCYEGRTNHGEQLAFREFLERNPDITATPFSTYSWHGQAFIVSRNRPQSKFDETTNVSTE